MSDVSALSLIVSMNYSKATPLISSQGQKERAREKLARMMERLTENVNRMRIHGFALSR